MPNVNITWYAPKVRRIMRDINALKLREIAEIEGITPQAVCKKLKSTSYDKELTNMIQILDIAGYEIIPKEQT